MAYKRFVPISLSIVLASVTGCEQGYKLAPVSGRVLLDKHPLANVDVSFHPTSGKDMPFASGVTDAEGNFTLQTFVGKGSTDGAVVGENRVLFVLSRTTSQKKTFSPRQGGKKEEPVIPAKYADSPLTFTVPPEGTQEAIFELTSR